jgi:hypothetical protein
MAGNEPNYLTNKSFSISQAVEFMKLRDKNPTKFNETIVWVNSKNGKRVSIGYT